MVSESVRARPSSLTRRVRVDRNLSLSRKSVFRYDTKGKGVKAVFVKLAMAGLPALVAVAIAAPASAQPATGAGYLENSVTPASSTADCPAGDLCFWVSANWVGKMGVRMQDERGNELFQRLGRTRSGKIDPQTAVNERCHESLPNAYFRH